MNVIVQALLTFALQLLAASLKNGIGVLAQQFLAGQAVTVAKVTINPGEFVAVTVQLEQKTA